MEAASPKQRKEKYVSLSHHRPDGSHICNNIDTVFLSLDKEKDEISPSSNQPSMENITPTGGLRASSNFSPFRGSGVICNGDTKQKDYDHFMAPQSHFHQVVLYETKLRMYLIGSNKDNSFVSFVHMDWIDKNVDWNW